MEYINTDAAANHLVKLANANNRDYWFHLTFAICPKCNRRLEYNYMENRTYAIRCVHCETLTLVKANNPEQAATIVGVVAIPLDEWTEDDGYVLCYRFPINDRDDVCIGNPDSIPPDIPDGFTHYSPLPCPIESREEQSNE